MVTSYDEPAPDNWVQGLMQAEASARRQDAEPEPEPDEPELAPDEDWPATADLFRPSIGTTRKDAAGAIAAVRAATGLDVTSLHQSDGRNRDGEDLVRVMTAAPLTALDDDPTALDAGEPEEWHVAPVEPSTGRAGVPGPAERHARTWREEHGLPRKKVNLSPSDGTQGRRERYARQRAAELGISFDDALAGIKVRPATTRAGRRKAAEPAQ
jgi:hypothetical protein